MQLHEAYLSVWEALKHSAIHHRRQLRILWVDSEELTPDTVAERLGAADGVIVPGGFGMRGIEGKIEAIQSVGSAGALPGRVSGHAVRGDRVRPRRSAA